MILSAIGLVRTFKIHDITMSLHFVHFLKFGELGCGFRKLPSTKHSLLFVDKAIVIVLFQEPKLVPSKGVETRSRPG